MNIRFLICLFCAALLVSCIQSEPLNTEADIEECRVVSPSGVVKDIRIENKEITFFVKAGADLSKMQLEFTLTSGAVLEDSRTEFNLGKEVRLVVVSEDGAWKKEYLLKTHVTETNIPLKFGFENAELNDGKYYRFYEKVGSGEEKVRLNIWDSGNEGYKLVAEGKKQKPEEYPTFQVAEGRTGKCAKLVTRATGFGMFGMPLAAGNLFIGKFNNKAINIGKPGASLKSTEFGGDFDFMPKAVKGYYKYKAGKDFLDENGKIMADSTDTFDIYAMVYEPTAEHPFVDGSDQFTSPALVMLARMKDSDRVETGEWKEFYIPFKSIGGRTIDPAKLTAGKYRISLIFTSSIRGDRFLGAAGSTLMVDDVEFEVEK